MAPIDPGAEDAHMIHVSAKVLRDTVEAVICRRFEWTEYEGITVLEASHVAADVVQALLVRSSTQTRDSVAL